MLLFYHRILPFRERFAAYPLRWSGRSGRRAADVSVAGQSMLPPTQGRWRAEEKTPPNLLGVVAGEVGQFVFKLLYGWQLRGKVRGERLRQLILWHANWLVHVAQ